MSALEPPVTDNLPNVQSMAHSVSRPVGRWAQLLLLSCLVLAAGLYGVWQQGIIQRRLEQITAVALTRPASYDMLHRDMEIALEVPLRDVPVREVIAFRMLAEADNSLLGLLLANTSRCTAARLLDAESLRFTQQGDKLVIHAPEAGWHGGGPGDDTIRVELEYTIQAGARSQAGPESLELLPDQRWHPHPVSLGDAYTWTIVVHHPAQVGVASSGESVAARDSAGMPGMQVSMWRGAVPVSGVLAVIASPEYTVLGTEEQVRFLSFPDEAEQVAEITGFAADCLDYLTETLGRPVPPVTIASSRRAATGMATPGLIVVPVSLWQTPGGTSGSVPVWTKHQLIAHELAHQWWGCSFEPPLEPGRLVLIEGMAEYWSYRCLSALGHDNWAASSRWLSYRLHQGLRDHAPLAQIWEPTRRFRDVEYQIYFKSAVALQQFELFLGRELFDVACRAMLSADKPRGLADFRGDLLNRAGDSAPQLEAVMHRWLDMTGVPAWRNVTYGLTPTGGQDDGALELSIAVRQSQPGFAVRVPVRVRYEDGEREDFWLEFADDPESRQTVLLSRQPRDVRVDPENLLLMTLDPSERVRILAHRFDAPHTP